MSKIIFANFRNFYINDGAHIQTSLHGTLFGFGGIDDDDQMECLVMGLYYYN